MALDKLQAEYSKIDVVQCDITVRPDVLALVETIRDRYGKIDVLVNNAGQVHWCGSIE
jgi:NAD(P)-dependent dehydrogenase (short-subunit alcohol dehydrogenase family)